MAKDVTLGCCSILNGLFEKSQMQMHLELVSLGALGIHWATAVIFIVGLSVNVNIY